MNVHKFFTVLILGLMPVLVFNACKAKPVEVPEEVEVEIVEVEEEIGPLTREEADAIAEEKAKNSEEIYTTAVQSGDLELCVTIESIDLQYSCEQNALSNLAVINEDRSVCKKLDKREAKKSCENNYDRLLSEPEVGSSGVAIDLEGEGAESIQDPVPIQEVEVIPN